MNSSEYRWLVEQKDQMLDKTLRIARKLQDARLNIARPYVLALQTQFPNTEDYELIRIADEDLQKSNRYYQKLTQKLAELQEFNQGPFAELVRMIKQIQP